MMMTQKFRALINGKLIGRVQPIFYQDKPVCRILDYIRSEVNEVMEGSRKNFYIEIPVDSIDQFTGVLDVNKQEIYERDIVEVPYGRGQVVFHAGCYMIQWIDDPEAMMEMLNFSNRDFKFGRARKLLKKVGNVYGVPVEKIPVVPFIPNSSDV